MSGWKSDSKTADAFAGTSLAVRCYESHPVLKIGAGTLIGGCARTPVTKQADIYVVLQRGDMDGLGSDPWEKKRDRIEVQYAISDMHAPSNVERFKKMVTWLCNQLQDGKTVHVGCIGGHGRTGTVLSAIVAEALEKKDAIGYVRKHYCKKAVESREQVDFLRKHYGVEKATPTKGSASPSSVSVWRGTGMDDYSLSKQSSLPLPKAKEAQPLLVGKVRRVIPEGATKATKSYGPMASKRSLWRDGKHDV